MIKTSLRTSDFDFELPGELIASHPLPERDASRMLVVNGPEHTDMHIRDFVKFLRRGDVVVFNNTRVIPVRFMASGHEITLHTSSGEDTWWGLCKKFQKIKRGTVLTMEDGTEIEVVGRNMTSGLKLHFRHNDIMGLLERLGKLPLPPYIKREQEESDRERYQTVYAYALGSMAAPTAGLHFTPELLEAIKARGAKIVNVTLHVGAGTWMTVKDEDFRTHKMHREWGRLTPEQARDINKAKRVIAVGTTSLRLLETAAIQNLRSEHPKRHLRVIPFKGWTNIFLTPGYKFKAADVLLTNFHLPKSTLFMLVSAFADLDNMKTAYQHAIDEKYRFFSYGDCCLLFKYKPKREPRNTDPGTESDMPTSGAPDAPADAEIPTDTETPENTDNAEQDNAE